MLRHPDLLSRAAHAQHEKVRAQPPDFLQDSLLLVRSEVAVMGPSDLERRILGLQALRSLSRDPWSGTEQVQRPASLLATLEEIRIPVCTGHPTGQPLSAQPSGQTRTVAVHVDDIHSLHRLAAGGVTQEEVAGVRIGVGDQTGTPRMVVTRPQGRGKIVEQALQVELCNGHAEDVRGRQAFLAWDRCLQATGELPHDSLPPPEWWHFSIIPLLRWAEIMHLRPSPRELPRREGAWWRAQATTLREWIGRTAGSAQPGWVLKTDLFDEASGPHHHAADFPAHVQFLGIDIDYAVARAARARLQAEGHAAALVVGDVRALPFSGRSIRLVVCLSTLDHFPSEEDIRLSLVELRRVLCLDGRMLLTLDNPLNPEVALRSWLPARLVRLLRADSFPLGATLEPGQANRLLAALGFSIDEQGYVIHAPRYPLIRLGRWLGRHGAMRLEQWLERAQRAMEGLGRTPLRALSGHYLFWILSPARGHLEEQPGRGRPLPQRSE